MRHHPGFIAPFSWSGIVAMVREDYQRFRRLDRFRQYILVGLAVVALLIVAAAMAYAVDPGDPSAMLSTSFSASARDSAVQDVAGIDGNYIDRDVPMTLELHQYGEMITGTWHMLGCAGSHNQTTTLVVIGHFLSDGSLSLTSATPDQPRATTTIYTIRRSAEQLDLISLDAMGQIQILQWSRLTTSQSSQLPEQAC